MRGEQRVVVEPTLQRAKAVFLVLEKVVVSGLPHVQFGRGFGRVGDLLKFGKVHDRLVQCGLLSGGTGS